MSPFPAELLSRALELLNFFRLHPPAGFCKIPNSLSVGRNRLPSWLIISLSPRARALDRFYQAKLLKSLRAVRRKILLLIRNLKYWKVKWLSLEHQGRQKPGNSANSLYSSDLLIRSAAKAQATWKAPAVHLTPRWPLLCFLLEPHPLISVLPPCDIWSCPSLHHKHHSQLQYAASPLSTTSGSKALQPLYPIIKSGGLFNAISLNPIIENRIFPQPRLEFIQN